MLADGGRSDAGGRGSGTRRREGDSSVLAGLVGTRADEMDQALAWRTPPMGKKVVWCTGNDWARPPES